MSIPTIVLLSEPKNSFGAYDGSVATVRVPLLLMAAGTEIDVSAFALGTVLCVLEPLLLLPQAASAKARLAAVPIAAERFTRLVRDGTWSPSDDGVELPDKLAGKHSANEI